MNHLKLFKILTAGICALAFLACQKPAASKTDPPTEGKRAIVKVDQGPTIGVNTEALNDLHGYRSAQNSSPTIFHLGRPATEEEIAAWDIDITPDGHGLPEGAGSVADGAALYALKCSACHGLKGEGVKPYSAFVAKESSGKTIGNFWPYATTVFDYVRRAMPFDKPGSLTNNEVYALTAWLLYKNEIISEAFIIDAESLPKITMPNADHFIPDDRESYTQGHP